MSPHGAVGSTGGMSMSPRHVSGLSRPQQAPQVQVHKAQATSEYPELENSNPLRVCTPRPSGTVPQSTLRNPTPTPPQPTTESQHLQLPV